MNPYQANKHDMSGWTPEQKLKFDRYKITPKEQRAPLKKTPKFFDSADFAMVKTRSSNVDNSNVGSLHPNPKDIPHHPSIGGSLNIPIKESPLLYVKSPMGSQQPIESEGLSSTNSTENGKKATSDSTIEKENQEDEEDPPSYVEFPTGSQQPTEGEELSSIKSTEKGKKATSDSGIEQGNQEDEESPPLYVEYPTGSQQPIQGEELSSINSTGEEDKATSDSGMEQESQEDASSPVSVPSH